MTDTAVIQQCYLLWTVRNVQCRPSKNPVIREQIAFTFYYIVEDMMSFEVIKLRMK